MNLLNKKRGTSKVMSIYWFAILVLVAGAIIYMVSIFYGNPYDVRELEANILINKVADCLSENGKLKYDLTNDFNLLEECHLNFNTADNEGQYYLEISSGNFPNQSFKSKINEGNVNLKTFFETSPSSNSIFKSEKSFYVLDKEDEKELVVKILTIISKTKENVG